MNDRVTLFNVIEPTYDAVRCSFFSGDIEVVSENAVQIIITER